MGEGSKRLERIVFRYVTLSMIVDELVRVDGNVRRAAACLDIDRQALCQYLDQNELWAVVNTARKLKMTNASPCDPLLDRTRNLLKGSDVY